jgi:uncharacterized protein DUF4394
MFSFRNSNRTRTRLEVFSPKLGLTFALASIVLFGMLAPVSAQNTAATTTIYAVTSGNSLIRFTAATPGTVVTIGAISGLQVGENVLGIDFRPRTGQLYALGSSSRLYTIDLTTAAATAIGSAGAFTLSGTNFGFDFNPTVDRIRVVSDTDQNLRLHPDTGALVATDTSLAYAAGDPNVGVNPNVVGSAYTNNAAGTISTTLFAIDSGLDILATQNPPNNGTLNTVGSLGVDTTGLTGFDVAASGTAYASLTAPAGTTSDLHTINLTTGAATLVGTIGGGGFTINDIAVFNIASPNVFGLQSSGTSFVKFNSATPGTIISTTTITGLQVGETILGIDFRPCTSQLFGLGSTSRLYTIDSATGAATQVGSSGAFTLSGIDFGFDFNPVVDRIRVVSDADQNLRLHPDTGALVATDTSLAYAVGDPNVGANPNVVGSAYQNNFKGTTTTTLFGIDSGLDILATQNPPNNGTLNTIGSLGAGVDTTGLTGFDVAAGSGVGYASLTAPSATSSTLNIVNFATGAVTAIGASGVAVPIGGGLTIKDIAVEFSLALASAGSTAVGSTSHVSGLYPASASINDDRKGNTWGTTSGGWNDGTRGSYDDWLEVHFNGSKTINEIDVYTLQNGWNAGAGEPDLTTSASGEGILDFDVDYWNGSMWVTVGSITSNDKAKQRFTFTAVSTTMIRVVVHNSRSNWSRIVEVEAFGCP